MPYGLPDDIIEKLKRVFGDYPQIQQVLLYGSRAKGNFQSGSDIDLCIEGEALSLNELFAIETQIDDLMLPWKVDLSLRHKIDNEALLDHLRRVGIPIFHKHGIASGSRRLDHMNDPAEHRQHPGPLRETEIQALDLPRQHTTSESD